MDIYVSRVHVRMRSLNNMADAWSEIRKDATCSICFGLLKEPKILPCLHTFCKRCLQDLWEKSADVARTDCVRGEVRGEILKAITCSTCLHSEKIESVDILPTNDPTQQLVELVRLEQQIGGEAPPSCQSCDNELGAVAVCLQCDVFLCTACVAVHKKLKLLSSHQVVSFDDFKAGKIKLHSVLHHKQERCSVHPDKSLELFCKDEGCFICLACAVVKHRNHQYDEISEVAKEYKTEINNMTPKIKTQLEKLEKAVTEVKNVQSQVELRKAENMQKVEKTFKEIKAALNKKKQQIVDDINQATASRIEVLDKQCEELTNKCTQLRNFLELVESKLQFERDRAIVSLKRQVVNRGDGLIRVARQVKLLPVEAVPPTLTFYSLQKVKEHIQGFGKPLDICIKHCQLTTVQSGEHNLHGFSVTVKDSHGQPVLDCMDAIDIKVFPNANSSIQEKVKTVITHEEIGRYIFLAVKCESCWHVKHYRGRSCQCKQYGSVIVQINQENVPGSPLR